MHWVSYKKGWVHIAIMKQHSLEAPGWTVNEELPLMGITDNSNCLKQTKHIYWNKANHNWWKSWWRFLCSETFTLSSVESFSLSGWFGAVWHWSDGLRKVWIHNIRCILSSSTSWRVHHAKVTVAEVFSRVTPCSWNSELHCSFSPSAPT